MDGSSSTLVQHPATVGEERTVLRDLQRTERRAPRNTCVLRDDGTGPRLRTLVAGWAFRCRTFADGRRQLLSILLPGDTFGIETLFDGPLDYLVWTATPVTYAVLDARAALAAFDADPPFRRHHMRTLAREKAEAERWMAQLGRCDAEERVASLLLLLYERLKELGLASDHTFRLELTQQELADMLGLHLIHLNRTLSRLRARGLIRMNKHDITLLDLERILELAPMPNQGSWMSNLA